MNKELFFVRSYLKSTFVGTLVRKVKYRKMLASRQVAATTFERWGGQI